MNMERSTAFTSILAFLIAAAGQAEDVIPKRFNFDRYAAIQDHSPFAVATAVAAPAATPNFAKDLYVANAARSPEGDMVTIASSGDKNFKEYLTTKGPVDGYTIASIEWSERVGATKVTISKDGQFATLSFNQALLSQSPGANPIGASGNIPQAVPNVPTVSTPIPGGYPRIPASSNLPTPPPHVRGVIQRNPMNALPVPQAQPNLTPTPSAEQ
jgi:hypothetical protein